MEPLPEEIQFQLPVWLEQRELVARIGQAEAQLRRLLALPLFVGLPESEDNLLIKNEINLLLQNPFRN